MEPKELKIEKCVKYYNIFSYLILKYILKEDVTLLAIYRTAYNQGVGASWYDVFDGVLWICSIVGGMIGIGYLLEVIK